MGNNGSNGSKDQLVVIHVEGMHCHKCQTTIRKALQANAGVHEVEVDVNAGLASVLFDPSVGQVLELMESINGAGYKAVSFTRGQAEEQRH